MDRASPSGSFSLSLPSVSESLLSVELEDVLELLEPLELSESDSPEPDSDDDDDEDDDELSVLCENKITLASTS